MADLPEPWGYGECVTYTAFGARLMGQWSPQARTRFPMPIYTADQLRTYAAAQVAQERERCARLVREAWSVHGLCCSDANALADLVAGLDDAIRATEAPAATEGE